MWFLGQILVSIVLAVVAYILMPRPKPPKPEAAKDLEVPTAEAGRPLPVIFGEGTIKSPNTLYYGQSSTRTQKVKM